MRILAKRIKSAAVDECLPTVPYTRVCDLLFWFFSFCFLSLQRPQRTYRTHPWKCHHAGKYREKEKRKRENTKGYQSNIMYILYRTGIMRILESWHTHTAITATYWQNIIHRPNVPNNNNIMAVFSYLKFRRKNIGRYDEKWFHGNMSKHPGHNSHTATCDAGCGVSEIFQWEVFDTMNAKIGNRNNFTNSFTTMYILIFFYSTNNFTTKKYCSSIVALFLKGKCIYLVLSGCYHLIFLEIFIII